MRTLVTGASGFAGGWLCRACAAAGEDVLGISRSGTAPDGIPTRAVDLCHAAAVAAVVREARPDVVHHLAALSNVGLSWSNPQATVATNAGGGAALLEAIRHEAPQACVVWVSSSEIYGTAPAVPIAEDVMPAPESPYAVSKLTGETLADIYTRAHGLRIVIARPFSHSGPGQSSRYLLSNLARRIAEARSTGAPRLELTTGNGEVRRDVTDVRDVVRAYRLLAASELTGVYNVCSGVTRSTAEQVDALGELAAPMHVEHLVDPALVRASEVMELRGDPSRLREATGWSPEIPYRQTLADTVGHWEHELA